MSKREALKIVRQLIEWHDAGHDNDTMAYLLQSKVKAIASKPKGRK